MNNDLSRRITELKKEFTRRGQRVEKQFIQDCTVIALNRAFAFGPDRIIKFFDAVNEVSARYSDVFSPENAEADVLREELDRVLGQIMGEDKIEAEPFETRYPDVKTIDVAGVWHDPSVEKRGKK